MFSAFTTVAASIICQLSANQTTNLTVGSRVRFNTATPTAGSIVLDTSTNIGQLTYTGPGRFFLFGAPRATVSGGTIEFRWFNTTTSASFGSIYHCAAPGVSSDVFSQTPMAAGFLNLGAGVVNVVELRIFALTATLTNITSESNAFSMKF